MNLRAVLVDVDMTLIDTNPLKVWAFTTWAAQHNLDPAPFIAGDGIRLDELLATHAPHLPLTEAKRIVDLAANCPNPPTPIRGAADLLASSSPLALVTSGRRDLTERNVAAAGLPLPEVIITAEDVTNGKPHPEPFLTAARRLGVHPEHCIVLEDSIPGVTAGIAAGMTVVALSTTVAPTHLFNAGARHVVADIAEFLRYDESDAFLFPSV